MTESEFSNIHERVFELLPWYVNQTLDLEEDALVEAHLQTCLVCRKEVETLRNVQSEVQMDDEVAASMQRTMGALQERIKQDAGQSGDVTSIFSRMKQTVKSSHRGVQLALMAQAAALVVAIGLLVDTSHQAGSQEYQTLTSTPSVSAQKSADFKVIFGEETRLAELSLLLSEHQLEIIEGPSAAKAFQLRSLSNQANLSEVFAALQKDPKVSFIQSMK